MSPFDCLKNADLVLQRETGAFNEDPATGNQIAVTENVEATAYFKSVKPKRDADGKIAQGVYSVKGWMVDPMNLPSDLGVGDVEIQCTIHNIGQGTFHYHRELHSAAEIVEDCIGDYLQGSFRIAGAGYS